LLGLIVNVLYFLAFTSNVSLVCWYHSQTVGRKDPSKMFVDLRILSQKDSMRHIVKL